MSADYWWGLATLPLAAIALLIVWVLVEPTKYISQECTLCGKRWGYEGRRVKPPWWWTDLALMRFHHYAHHSGALSGETET